MPGSILQSVISENVYDAYWEFSPRFITDPESWANSSTGIFTVPSHPFTTGDIMYVSLRLNQPYEGFPFRIGKYYAIVISSTELKHASTKENALNGISLNIPGNLWTVPTDGVLNGIGNTPDCGYNYFNLVESYKPDTWLSSSRSTDAFDISTNVRIQWTHTPQSLTTKQGGSYALATPTFGSFFGVAYWREGLGIGGLPGDNISFQPPVGSTGTLRFEIMNREISFWAKLAGESFERLYTTTQLPESLDPLYFHANFGIKNMSATNCTITYL